MRIKHVMILVEIFTKIASPGDPVSKLITCLRVKFSLTVHYLWRNSIATHLPFSKTQ